MKKRGLKELNHSAKCTYVDEDYSICRLSADTNENNKAEGLYSHVLKHKYSANSENVVPLLDWHHDGINLPGDHYGTVIYNHHNGHIANISFYDQVFACQLLSDQQKEILKATPVPWKLQDNTLPFDKSVFTNMIQIHPITNEACLYLDHRLEISLPLVKQVIKPEKVHTIHLMSYDIIMFDNMQVIHKREEFKGDRVLWKINFDYSKCHGLTQEQIYLCN